MNEFKRKSIHEKTLKHCHLPQSSLEIANTIANLQFYILVTTKDTFLVQHFQVVRNISVILNDIVNLFYRDISTLRNVESIEKSRNFSFV